MVLVMVYGRGWSECYSACDDLESAVIKAKAASIHDPECEYWVEREAGSDEGPGFKNGRDIT